MAWSITDLFPPWGDSGDRPADNFQYQGGDQVSEATFDYLWSSLRQLQEEVRSALNDIDSDSDGIVDEADYANDADASAYKGNDIDSNGDGIVDTADDANLFTGKTLDQVATNVRERSTELTIETRTSDPSSPDVGEIWLRTDL